MTKHLFVIAGYSGHKKHLFDTYISPKNKIYCDRHGVNYLELKENIPMLRGNYTWSKFYTIKKYLEDGRFQPGDVVINFDADMVVVKPDLMYPHDKSFNYAIDNGNTHCMGNFAVRLDEWGINLIDNILSEERFQKLQHHRSINPSANGGHHGFWGDFREQASWYSCAGIKRHSWVPFFDLPDYGWHSEKDEYTLYTIPELYEHVQVLGPEWDTTILPGEGDQTYNITKSKKEDTRIRHYAGGTAWFEEYLTREF